MMLVLIAGVLGTAYLIESRQASRRSRELCLRRLEALLKV